MNKILRCFALMIGLLSVNFGWAQTYTVTTTAFDAAWWVGAFTPNSLSDALDQANKGNITKIVFDLPDNSTIQTGASDWTYKILTASNIEINGWGNNNLTIAGSGQSPALIMRGDNLKVKNLQFTTTAATRGGLEYQTNNSLVDSCTFINGNLYVGHIQQPAVYVQENIIRNCDIQSGDLQIMGALNTVLNTTILGQLIIGHQGTDVLSNNNEIIDCTGMAQGSTIYGNENEITNAQINVTQILPNGDNPAAGINIIGNKNIVKKSTISNTLTVNNAKATEGIRLSGAASFENVIDSIEINGYWNGVYITDNAKQNTISNNKMNKSVNMGIYLYDNADNNTLTNNVIDDVEIGNGIYIRLSKENTASKNTVTNVKLGNGFSIHETTGKNTLDSNVVYSNVGAGILMANALNTEVTNNVIGQDLTGTTIGGNSNGISISEGGSGNIVKTNIIVANLNGGIVIDNSTTNTIVSNAIGDVLKTNSALENNGNGILVQNGAKNNTIGKSGEGNLIQNKTKTFAAIQIDGATTTGNTIQGNILSCNAGKGIELSDGGNEEYSSKASPNWVTINNAEPTPYVISGKFQTKATGTVRIDFYITGDCQTRCSSDATGNITQNELAQGKTWLMSQPFDATIGEWSYTLTAADTTAGLTTDNVIVTATDGAGNTSEFAVCEFDPPCTKPTSVVLAADNNAVCDGASITMTATATPLNSLNVFEWYKNDTLLSTTATTLTIDKIAQNGTYKVFVYDLDKNLCGLNSNTLDVKINDNPTDPTFTDNAKELCQGTGNSTVSVTEVAGMKYQWTADNIVSGQNTKEITVDFTTATNPTVIKVKAIDIATGCESAEITTNVTINDNPKPVINGEAAPLCNAAGVIYNVVSADTSSNYVWTIPTGATQIGDKSLNNDTITVDYSDSNGNITVTETNAKGCVGTSDDFAIALKSCGLKANFSFDNADLCVESSLQKNNVTFTDQSTGDDIVLYVWDFGTDATPSTQGTQGPHTVQYATTGTKIITLTITDNVGTESKYTDSVIVNDIPNTNDFMIEGDGGCENTTTSFEVKENNGSGVDLSLYDYDWSNTPDAITNGQGTDSINVLLGGDKNGNVKVKIADKTTTCQIEKSKDYDITVQPDFNINIGGNDTICDGFSQFSEFENKTSYTYSLSKSLSEIHPQTDSIFIYWTLTDKDGNVTTLEEDGQQGSYSGDDDTTNTKQTQVIIKPGYITKEEFKDYSLSVIISKRGACADSTVVPIQRSIKINQSHEYKFSIKDVLVCEEESPEFNAQLMIDGVETTYSKEWWKYLHNWSYVNADKTPSEKVTTPNPIVVIDFITGEIKDTLYKYKDTNPYKVGANDSLLLNVESDKFCYKKESIFNDTLVDFTVRRPAGIIGMGTKNSGFPDTTELILQDVEEITLKDMNSLNNTDNTKWEWTWKKDENFVSDSIIDAAALSTVHYPRAIREIMYRLVTNNGTCTDTVYATVTNLLLPFVPNAVSPNGDGVFDEWVIHNSENYPEMTVKVFNRWGSLVYESEKGYPVNWTGQRSNGEDLPTGTYFYVIEFNSEIVDAFAEDETTNPYSTARNKEASLKSGSITIMR